MWFRATPLWTSVCKSVSLRAKTRVLVVCTRSPLLGADFSAQGMPLPSSSARCSTRRFDRSSMELKSKVGGVRAIQYITHPPSTLSATKRTKQNVMQAGGHHVCRILQCVGLAARSQFTHPGREVGEITDCRSPLIGIGRIGHGEERVTHGPSKHRNV